VTAGWDFFSEEKNWIRQDVTNLSTPVKIAYDIACICYLNNTFVKTCAAFVIDFYVFIFNRRFYPSDLQVTKGTSQTVFQRFTAQI